MKMPVTEIILCSAWIFLYAILAGDAKRALDKKDKKHDDAGWEKYFLRTTLFLAVFFFVVLASMWRAFPFMRQWLAGYMPALFLTLVIEGTAAYALGYRTRRELCVALLCSFATHPALYVAAALLSAASGEALMKRWDAAEAVLETFVVLAEYGILRSLLPGKGVQNAKLGVVMNLVSYLTGRVIYK
jgi:hypothetical protein